MCIRDRLNRKYNKLKEDMTYMQEWLMERQAKQPSMESLLQRIMELERKQIRPSKRPPPPPSMECPVQWPTVHTGPTPRASKCSDSEEGNAGRTPPSLPFDWSSRTYYNKMPKFI